MLRGTVGNIRNVWLRRIATLLCAPLAAVILFLLGGLIEVAAFSRVILKTWGK